MQRNQSFFAPAPHLYIYDYFLSSRAKVNKFLHRYKYFVQEISSPPDCPGDCSGNRLQPCPRQAAWSYREDETWEHHSQPVGNGVPDGRYLYSRRPGTSFPIDKEQQTPPAVKA